MNETDAMIKVFSSFVKRGNAVSTVRKIVLGDNERLLADLTAIHVLDK